MHPFGFYLFFFFSFNLGTVANELASIRTIFKATGLVFRFFINSPKLGAQTVIMLAADPDLWQVSGKYFEECNVANESERARDDERAKWLWEESEKYVKIKEPSGNITSGTNKVWQ